MFFSLPVIKLSIITTSCPKETKSLTTCDAIKPAPPVTNIFNSDSPKNLKMLIIQKKQISLVLTQNIYQEFDTILLV